VPPTGVAHLSIIHERGLANDAEGRPLRPTWAPNGGEAIRFKCEVESKVRGQSIAMLSTRPERWIETIRDVPGPTLSATRARSSLVSARGSRPNDRIFFHAGFDRVTDNEPVARLRDYAGAAAPASGFRRT
jgi:hypothetical protein